MQVPSITITRDSKGKLEVLALSDEAQECHDAYYKFDKAGYDVYYLRHGELDLHKQYHPAEAPKKTAKKSAPIAE